MPGRGTQKVNKKALADFKVGVDNVIFSVDTQQNRLLVLLVMRQDQPFLGSVEFARDISTQWRIV
jgi:hypothetical protein